MTGTVGHSKVPSQALFFKGPFFSLPVETDVEYANQKIEDLRDSCADLKDGPLAQNLLATLSEPDVCALLRAVFSNSPFLTRCALSDPPFLQQILELGPDTGLCLVIDEIKDELSRETDADTLRRGLRIARTRVALLVAFADITGTWSLERVTQALSDFADVAVSAAVSHLLTVAADKGDLVLKDEYFPEFESGYFALAMGKYGARELNYSSDIDLIVVYDPVKLDYRGNRSVQQFLIRMTRDLVSLLQDTTKDGYVFRVDLRLRPDPGSTPIAIPYANALTYYETRGAGWERAAMIKARPAIGDLTLGRRFLSELGPFVWRPNVDFWAQREMQKIKRQINEHRGGVQVDFLGHNIKLGRGGIREIEFFAQSHQLVYGGRDPYLRSNRTLDALSTLAEAGHISDRTADELTEAYEFLRQLEHRLQMVNDQQTQTLPGDDEGMNRIAAFMGYENVENFRDVLLGYLRTVEERYTEVFEGDDDSIQDTHRDVLTIGDRNETVTALSDLGFATADNICNVFQRWKDGAYSAIRDERCREILTDLMPHVIETAMKSDEPDAVIEAFDGFLRQLKSGMQLLSIISSNQQAFDFLFESLAAAPAPVLELSRWPERLQCVLSTGTYDEIPDPRVLDADCRRSRDGAGTVEDMIDSIAAWSHEERFKITLQFCEHAIDGTVAGRALANIADAVIRNIYSCRDILADSRETGDTQPLLLLAMGGHGAQELTHGQSSDLLFVSLEDPAESVRTLHAARRLLNALSSETSNGSALAVNLLSSPYGIGGPIVTQFLPFLSHVRSCGDPAAILALVKLRIIAGDETLAAATQPQLDGFFLDGQAWQALLPNLAELAARFSTATPSGPWDTRRGAGGLDQLDALISLLRIRHAQAERDGRRSAHATIVASLVDAGALDEELGKKLVEAHHLMHQVENFLATTTDGRLNPDAGSSRFKASLARSCGADELDHVRDMLVNARAIVTTAFEEVVMQNG
jgi:glutamate-ammonia-ligase adenylyltransferase